MMRRDRLKRRRRNLPNRKQELGTPPTSFSNQPTRDLTMNAPRRFLKSNLLNRKEEKGSVFLAGGDRQSKVHGSGFGPFRAPRADGGYDDVKNDELSRRPMVRIQPSDRNPKLSYLHSARGCRPLHYSKEPNFAKTTHIQPSYENVSTTMSGSPTKSRSLPFASTQRNNKRTGCQMQMLDAQFPNPIHRSSQNKRVRLLDLKSRSAGLSVSLVRRELKDYSSQEYHQPLNGPRRLALPTVGVTNGYLHPTSVTPKAFDGGGYIEASLEYYQGQRYLGSPSYSQQTTSKLEFPPATVNPYDSKAPSNQNHQNHQNYQNHLPATANNVYRAFPTRTLPRPPYSNAEASVQYPVVSHSMLPLGSDAPRRAIGNAFASSQLSPIHLMRPSLPYMGSEFQSSQSRHGNVNPLEGRRYSGPVLDVPYAISLQEHFGIPEDEFKDVVLTGMQGMC
ncbi:hypothetical protein AAMO2058_001580300 [Amorphochlora amoebiformis]